MKVTTEFELDDLLEAFLGVRIDNARAILKALGVDLRDERFRPQFQGLQSLEQQGVNLVQANKGPVPSPCLSSSTHPENAVERKELHRTFVSPKRSVSRKSRRAR